MGRPVSRRGPEGESVDSPTYIPQNDPHNALIILNIHKWGKIFFSKKMSHQLRLPSAKVRPRSRVGSQNVFLCFSPIFEFSTKI